MEQRFLRSLLKPAAYPESTSAVELVQTHVSYIFLTDDYAYKVKKPVDFGFLNFSTLDRRRFYCDEEVRLNRRLCPSLYLGVVEVRETASDGAAFFGEGRIVDYAVKMKRLPAERMLDRLLAAGGVGGNEVRALARTVAAFHLQAERNDEIAPFGSIDTIRGNWEENFNQTRIFCGTTLGGRDFLAIEQWVERFLKENSPLFAERVAGGFIRDGDGDLHLENISLGEDGSICIFDCIEFNARFRYGDTAADIAFLLMDFDANGRPDLSALFLDEYIRATGDGEISRIVDFYKVYRAYVRGKVESLRFADHQIPEPERNTARERAARYFRLARGYICRRNLPPTLIITCGPSGSGKSFAAREIALELGLEIISSDVVRKELAGLPPHARRAEGYGEGIYAAAVTTRTYAELLRRAEARLAAGRGVIVDATFRHAPDRLPFRTLAARHGARFSIIHATCGGELVRRRLADRGKDPAEPSDGRWEIYQRQMRDFDPPSADEGTVVTIDTSRSVAEIADSFLEALGILPCG
ncbi:bifunctional aminoglycoside phosphotransferase/ATP-binding protein [Geobacter pickeringii]|uniref:Kinase n=1 Tax=Geobacter pickeringii TaxID=345632 RepID=A0A0B5BF34_9BACT|nr:bifunctional aminoglycoside phosphotransferase/ATP-binding protein [Geobacter pickeringii]AJE03759.1 kinase [Geobacter pickeringii]